MRGKLYLALALSVLGAVIWTQNVRTISGYEHHIYVYPNGNGWAPVAASYSGNIQWAYDPTFPTSTTGGVNIRNNMNAAAADWNSLRTNNASPQPGFFTRTDSYSGAAFRYAKESCLPYNCGTNVRIMHAGATSCADPLNSEPVGSDWSDFSHGHGYFCDAKTTLDPNWDVSETVLRAAIAHEMGHVLGLQHPGSYGNQMPDSCNLTIMGVCWQQGLYLPGNWDEQSADSVYGIPYGTSIQNVDGMALAQAYDKSQYDTGRGFYEWKWNAGTSQWNVVHWHPGVPAWPQFYVSTDPAGSHGCGWYQYGAWAYNEYPNGVSAWQVRRLPDQRGVVLLDGTHEKADSVRTPRLRGRILVRAAHDGERAGRVRRQRDDRRRRRQPGRRALRGY